MQARVPRVHDTYRYRTVVQCVSKLWRHTTTQKGSLFIKQYPRSTAGLRHVCMIQKGVLARRRAGGKHTKATLHCAVRRAQGSARLHSGCHLRRCKRRQGAAPRSWRPRLQEQKVWSARGEASAAARRGRRRAHGMASRLGPGRGRTPGWDVGPGRGRGVCILAPSLAGSCKQRARWHFPSHANSERPPT